MRWLPLLAAAGALDPSVHVEIATPADGDRWAPTVAVTLRVWFSEPPANPQDLVACYASHDLCGDETCLPLLTEATLATPALELPLPNPLATVVATVRRKGRVVARDDARRRC